MTDITETNPYDPGHPWYYVLGGTILRPTDILRQVKEERYKGYRYDITEADCKQEPRRSLELRRIKRDVLREFWSDISIYRRKVRELRHHRQTVEYEKQQPHFNDIHQAMSLKYCHLYNDFAHLIEVDKKLSRQMDLFDFSGKGAAA